MLRIRIRNWVGRRWGRTIQASAHDAGYLERLPWLKQFVPLFKKVSPWDADTKAIRFLMIDQLTGTERHHLGMKVERYLVTKDGRALGQIQQQSVSGEWQTPILRALTNLELAVCHVAYLVVVDRKYDADITVYKFPPDRARITIFSEHVTRLAKEARDAEDLKQQRLAERKLVAGKEAARDAA